MSSEIKTILDTIKASIELHNKNPLATKSRNKWLNGTYIYPEANSKDYLSKYQVSWVKQAPSIENSEQTTLMAVLQNKNHKIPLAPLVEQQKSEQEILNKITTDYNGILERLNSDFITSEEEFKLFVSELYLIEVNIRLNLNICRLRLQIIVREAETLLDSNGITIDDVTTILKDVLSTSQSINQLIENYTNSKENLKNYIQGKKTALKIQNEKATVQLEDKAIALALADIENAIAQDIPKTIKQQDEEILAQTQEISAPPQNSKPINFKNLKNQLTHRYNGSMRVGSAAKKATHPQLPAAWLETKEKRLSLQEVSPPQKDEPVINAENQIKDIEVKIKEVEDKLTIAEDRLRSILETIFTKITTATDEAALNKIIKLHDDLINAAFCYFISKTLNADQFKQCCHDAIETAKTLKTPEVEDQVASEEIASLWSQLLAKFIALVKWLLSPFDKNRFSFFASKTEEKQENANTQPTGEIAQWNDELEQYDTDIQGLALP